MKNTECSFIIDQKKLLNILSSMQPICSKRTALDATSSILFHVSHKELILKSTDLEVSLQTSCPLSDSNIPSEAVSFLVSGKKIFEIVKELDGPINIKLKDHQLELTTDLINVALNIKDSEQFPPFPDYIENIMPLDATLFSKMLDSVAFLIPQNNTNAALNGLLLEITDKKLTMTTTDGHCLAQISTKETTLPEAKTWLLPRRAIFELKKILESSSKDQTIFLGICDNQLVFSGELFNFFTKLLTDTFPDYKHILSREKFFPSSVDKKSLLKALRRSVCLLSGQFIATKFEFSKKSVVVSLENKEVGNLNEEIPVDYSSATNLNMRFYAPYVLNGLQSIQDSTINFYLKDNTKPIIFESNTDTYNMVYLVMPVSLDN